MQIGEAVVSGASQGPKGGVLAVFLIGAPLMAWNSRPFDPSKVACVDRGLSRVQKHH
jgi:hypothetical protein